jgi:8-oxo-dGTP diphosphatase
MKKNYKVVAAIIIDNGRALCAQRNHGYFKDRWEFPGGKVETFETKEDALIREIQEELSIKIEIDCFFMDVTYEYQDFIINLSTYLCRTLEDNIKLVDHSAVVWKKFVEMAELEWCEADEIVVKALIKST